MRLTQKREAILEALQEGALTREELKAELAEQDASEAYSAIIQMSDVVTWRMIEVEGEATPQYALRSVGFEPQAAVEEPQA